jgi:hypothetical protein
MVKSIINEQYGLDDLESGTHIADQDYLGKW